MVTPLQVNREDHAESYLAWIASRYKSDRISSNNINFIESRIPNRLNFYDANIPEEQLAPISGLNAKISGNKKDEVAPWEEPGNALITSFKLYPLPTSGKFSVDFGLEVTGPVALKIFRLKRQGS